MGLLRGREKYGPLMHAFISTTYLSGFSVYSFSFSVFFFYLTSLPFPPPSSLFITTPFYTICCGGICHFYPLTAFGSLWVSFKDCPLAAQTLPLLRVCWLHHSPVLDKIACLIFTSLPFHFTPLDKDPALFHHLPL